MNRIYLLFTAAAIVLAVGGCSLVNEVKDSNRKYDEKQKEKKANPPEKSVLPASLSNCNDTEKQELEAVYKQSEKERSETKKKVFGGFLPN
jgi:uncharacterized lipoprotein